MNCQSKLAPGGLLLTAMLMLCAAPPMSAVASNPHLTVELRSRDSALAPSQDATLGVYFKLESGWRPQPVKYRATMSIQRHGSTPP